MTAVYDTPVGDLLFIHVPKTGGGTISAHLSQAFGRKFEANAHIPVSSATRRLKHYHGAILAQLLATQPPSLAFMIVRNPVERIVSEFKWQSRKPQRFYRRLSFSLWLKRNLARAAKDPFLRDNHFRPQIEFEAFNPKVFRFEDGLEACYAWLQTVAGVASPTSRIHHNRSRAKPIVVSPNDLALIADFYRADFERYGYAPTATMNSLAARNCN